MKRIVAWAGIGTLVAAISLTGTAFPEEQTKETAPKKAETSSSQQQKVVGPGKGDQKQGDVVIATVNGNAITMRELILEMNQIGPSLIKDPKQKSPETDKKVKETALGILVFRELAVQEAVRQGIKAHPSAVGEARILLKHNLGSEDNYKKYLQKMDLTEESLGRMLKRDILFTQITTREIFQKAKANDKAAIEKRKKQWEKSLKKKAKIEILLPPAEKEMPEEPHKGK
jgi:hypothetical protein